MNSQQNKHELILCPHCDLLVQIPTSSVGYKAVCPRCKTTLSIYWREPNRLAMGHAFAALLMLLLANLYSFVTMEVQGIVSQMTLLQIPQVMVTQGYVSLAILFVIFVQLLPAFCMISILLLCSTIYVPQFLKIGMAKAIFLCKVWCMAEIFLVGVLVSFVKLMVYGDIGIGMSFLPYCLFCLLQIRVLQFIDRRWLWLRIAPLPIVDKSLQPGITGLSQGVRSCSSCSAILLQEQKQCPRCLSRGHIRRRQSIQWTLAFLLTAVVLYIPANLLPIMTTQVFGNSLTSTIMSGVYLLWGEGSYPVAMVIFVASIVIPSLKILAIIWLCYDVKWGKHNNKGQMLFVYKWIEFVGRWSMIDVFVIAVLATLVQMGNFMGVYPDIGAILFAAVVILTMLSAMVFDPRLIWDRVTSLNEKDIKRRHDARE